MTTEFRFIPPEEQEALEQLLIQLAQHADTGDGVPPQAQALVESILLKVNHLCELSAERASPQDAA